MPPHFTSAPLRTRSLPGASDGPPKDKSSLASPPEVTPCASCASCNCATSCADGPHRDSERPHLWPHPIFPQALNRAWAMRVFAPDVMELSWPMPGRGDEKGPPTRVDEGRDVEDRLGVARRRSWKQSSTYARYPGDLEATKEPPGDPLGPIAQPPSADSLRRGHRKGRGYRRLLTSQSCPAAADRGVAPLPIRLSAVGEIVALAPLRAGRVRSA
jgi:hypothetical protein